MISFQNRIVFITGASSGIGAACAKIFASQKTKLILAARRIERIKQLAKDLTDQYAIEVLPLKLDVQNKQHVSDAIKDLPDNWHNIDILINNAGLALDSLKIQHGNIDNWDTMINTNINGLLYVTRAILPKMIARNQGHIINIGSIAGHDCYSTGNVYCATKHAVKALSKSMRIDLLGSGIRVSEIDPGAVHTEFSEVRWQDKARSDDFYAQFTPLTADDIADGVLYCATRPLHVDISEMIICPTQQATPEHIHKKGEKLSSFFD